MTDPPGQGGRLCPIRATSRALTLAAEEEQACATTLVVIAAIGAVCSGWSGHARSARGRNGGAAQFSRSAGAACADLPTGKTAYWTHEDILARWKDNEAKKRINSRLFNGPTNISANVRIVLAR
jgi:hypothetical protein